MNQNGMATQEDELSDWEHSRRVFLEHPIEESFFISSVVLRKGKAETLLEDFDQCKLTRGQLERYIHLANKLEDSLLRRTAWMGHVVHATTGAWLAHKPKLSDEDWDALMADERVVGLMAVVVAFEKALAGVVPASADSKIREAYEALGVDRPHWEKFYDVPVEDWRENGAETVQEDADAAKKRRRGCRALNKRDGLP
ncbi:hypothetical protein LY78DRAFT_144570 [Colletotrichum sublineola]|uniref:Uncharacterized protein n=1 Tax=Colletotrichum sublineola TaxID=1173701 RepID=A0A066XT88_COLSU|nr:hypothetical protein LY78DRAFT_144570 [Colletotrichum sublineola]KDN70919.1 hypothetical protein CSUB01_03733 [Colletotrichum sublineola]